MNIQKRNGEMLVITQDRLLEMFLEEKKVMNNFKTNTIKINSKKGGYLEFIE